MSVQPIPSAAGKVPPFVVTRVEAGAHAGAVHLRPRRADLVIEEALLAVLQHDQLRWRLRDAAIAATLGNEALALQCVQEIAGHEEMTDALIGETWDAPAALELAELIVDAAAVDCQIDRHCGLGGNHTGRCVPAGGEER